MWLTATTQKFQISLTEAETTQSRWWVSYRDMDVNGNFLTPVTINGQTNGTTTVDLFSGPSTGMRELIRFFWNNADNQNHNVTVQLNDNGTVRQEISTVVAQTISLCYHTLKSWYLFPNNPIQPGNVFIGPTVPGSPGQPTWRKLSLTDMPGAVQQVVSQSSY